MAAAIRKPGTLVLAVSLAFGASAAAAPPEAAAPFRIGVAVPPGEELSAVERAFSAALGGEVEVVVTDGYAELIEAQINRRVDYALYSAPAYAAASIRCGCLRPLAAPVAADGAEGVRSVLILRRGGGGQGDGPARIAIGPPDSLATRLAPLALWRDAGRMRAEGRLVEAASAGEAEAMFLRGAVDGFFGWVPARAADDGAAPAGGSLARLRAAGPGGAEHEIGWLSPLLRHGPHAVRADMPPQRVEALRAAILREGAGLAAVSQDDYAPVTEALKALEDEGG